MVDVKINQCAAARSEDRSAEDIFLENFQCPVCYDFMDSKIYICNYGHSLCIQCLLKLKKCPICKEKFTVARRNINLEKAAETIKDWLTLHKPDSRFLIPGVISDVAPTLSRRQRLSVDSALYQEPSDEFLSKPDLECPSSPCSFTTRHLLQLKIHLQNCHYKEIQPVKQRYDGQPRTHIRVRLYWALGAVFNMFLLSSIDAIFLVYIVRISNSIQKASSHYINVLTISDQTSMYKFSCGELCKFCMFYQGEHQTQEGIEIDENSVEISKKKGVACYFTKLNIKKVASLYRD